MVLLVDMVIVIIVAWVWGWFWFLVICRILLLGLGRFHVGLVLAVLLLQRRTDNNRKSFFREATQGIIVHCNSGSQYSQLIKRKDNRNESAFFNDILSTIYRLYWPFEIILCYLDCCSQYEAIYWFWQWLFNVINVFTFVWIQESIQCWCCFIILIRWIISSDIDKRFLYTYLDVLKEKYQYSFCESTN